MQNPLLKNNKTWLYGDLQHRTSHYNRIICARSAYPSTNSPKRDKIVDHLRCKFQNNVEAERKIANKKLVRSLLEIQQRESSFRDRREEGKGEVHSLKSQFCEREVNGKIMGQNLELFKRIVHASSEIGSKKKWRSRKKKLQNYSKIHNNKRQAFMNLDQQFYSVYQKIRQKKHASSVIKVESSFNEGQKMSSLRLKKREKCYTQPIENSEQDL